MKTMNFVVGDSYHYAITDSETLMIINETRHDTCDVTILFCPNNRNYEGETITLQGNHITPITLSDYVTKYDLSVEDCAKIIERCNALRSIFDTDNNRSWDNIPELIKQAKGLLVYYGYDKVTDSALDEIIKTENNNKGWIDTMLSNHPDYVPEKHYIVTKRKFHRNVIKSDINDFYAWFTARLYYTFAEKYAIVESEIANISKETATTEYYENRNIIASMNSFPVPYNVLYNGYNIEYYTNEMHKYSDVISRYNSYSRVDNTYIPKEKYAELTDLQGLISSILSEFSPTMENENLINSLNVFFEGKTKFGGKTKFAAKGQKVTRVMGKIAKEFGIDKFVDMQKISWLDENGTYHEKEKDIGWNKQYAMLCDALNPMETERWVVISINPIDYWTMSFGHKWASCHTIDKDGIRENDGHTYGGCYSSGTESYMLDSSTVIMYLVDGDYKGNDYEMEDKLKRCNFHIGENKIVQGRVYPDGRDGGDEDNIAKEMRMIMQEIVSECCGIENKWTLNKGTEACYNAICEENGKTNYSDYFNYNDCNVSTLKGTRNVKKIIVGHAPICPCCGNEHGNCENIMCEPCASEIICHDCGCCCEDDYEEIDGNYYCRDCVSYCEYHERFEPNDEADFTYVSNYGCVCLDALENGECFEYDAWENEWFNSYCEDDVVYTSDGNVYRNTENAIDAGYEYNEETYEWERREN